MEPADEADEEEEEAEEEPEEELEEAHEVGELADVEEAIEGASGDEASERVGEPRLAAADSRSRWWPPTAAAIWPDSCEAAPVAVGCCRWLA